MKKGKLRLFKHQILITSIAVFAVVVSMIGGSYAIFSDSSNSRNEYNVIQIGDLEISYVDNGNGYGDILSLNGSYPMTNTEGAATTPYRFSIENTGDVPANFKIKLVNDEEITRVDGCSGNLLDPQYIMYKLDNDEPKLLSSTAASGYVIYSGEGLEKYDCEDENDDCYDSTNLTPGSSQIHELRIWLKSDAPNDILGKHFHGKVIVEGTQAGVDSRLTTTYEIGTKVKLVDNSLWYVLSNSSTTDATVTLIKDTTLSNMAFDTESLRANSSYCNDDANGCNMYQANNSTVLNDATIKTYLETTYLDSLKSSLTTNSGNVDGIKVSLPSMEELASADGQQFNQTQVTFSNTTSKAFLVNSTYWTKTPAKTSSSHVWYVASTTTNSNVAYANNTEIGVRPVVTLSKLNIAEIVTE